MMKNHKYENDKGINCSCTWTCALQEQSGEIIVFFAQSSFPADVERIRKKKTISEHFLRERTRCTFFNIYVKWRPKNFHFEKTPSTVCQTNITRSDNLLIMSVYLEIERQNVLPQQ